MPIRPSIMPKKPCGTSDYNSYSASCFGRLKASDRCVSLFTAETRTSHVSEVQQELCFVSEVAWVSHRWVCVLHIAWHNKGSPFVTRNWRKTLQRNSFENFNLFWRCVHVLWRCKNNQERLPQRVDFVIHVNVQHWNRHVILSTRKMNVEFLVAVYAQFLSYSRKFNHSSVLLFSEVIRSFVLQPEHLNLMVKRTWNRSQLLIKGLSCIKHWFQRSNSPCFL